MVRVYPLIKYGIKEFFRRKDVVFWNIAWPILWLIIVAFVFAPPPTTSVVVKVLIMSNDTGLTNVSTLPPFINVTHNFTKVLINAIENINGSNNVLYHIKVLRGLNESYVRDLMIKKSYDLALIIPSNASKSYSLWIPVRVNALIKGALPNEILIKYGYLMNLLSNFTVNTTLSRIHSATEFVVSYWNKYANITLNRTVKANYSKYVKKYMEYFFYGISFPVYPNVKEVKPKSVADRAGIIGWSTIGAIGMSLMTGLLTAGAAFLAHMKESGMFRRVLASPITFRELITTDILKSLIIASMISAIIIFIGLALGGRIIINPYNIMHYVGIAMLLIAALNAYGIGLLLAPITKSSRAVSGATALGLILVFLTGIWWPPREMLPQFLKVFSQYFPPSCAFEVVRGLIVWGKDIADVMNDFIVALTGTVLLYIVIVLVYRGSIREIAERFIT